MRERQERQKQIVGAYRNRSQSGLDILQDVAVTEHDPFRPAGGSGRVDESGRRVGTESLAVEFAAFRLEPGIDRSGIGGRIPKRLECDDPSHSSQVLVDRLVRLPLGMGLDEQQRCPGIPQDPGDVRRAAAVSSFSTQGWQRTAPCPKMIMLRVKMFAPSTVIAIGTD